MTVLRIGTRSSELAMYQATLVAELLKKIGVTTTIKKIASTGDINTNAPLHQLGITGVFTKTMDDAMLMSEIDIAVHSLKDVPTELPEGIIKTATLKRHKSADILVHKNTASKKTRTIATGSLRRKAQWLHRYPKDTVVNLRGNVNTRLEKLANSHWDAAIFAQTGLERIGLLKDRKYEVLDWMIPAPAQGAIVITTMQNNTSAIKVCEKLNDRETEICTTVERDFMKTLEGGCTAPIGAKVEIIRNNLFFKGVLTNLNGEEQITVEGEKKIEQHENLGKEFGKTLIKKGGDTLLQKIKTQITT